MMRALGPGSVSSLLKLVLDVISFALWGDAGGAAGRRASGPAPAARPRHLAGDDRDPTRAGPMLPRALLAFAAYVGVVLFILARLRRLFATPDGRRSVPSRQRRAPALDRVFTGRAGASQLRHQPGVRLGLPRPVPLGALSLQSHRWFAVLVVFVPGGGVPRGCAPAQRSGTDDLDGSRAMAVRIKLDRVLVERPHVAERAGRPRGPVAG